MSKKTFFYLILFFLIAQGSFAQNTQTGLVREFNSGKEPLPNVGVEFFGAGAASSGVDGRFVLNFIKEKEPGALVTLQRVIKSGYEIVNETDLQGLRFTNDGKLAKDIVLAKNGVIDAAKAEYAGASMDALTNGYTRERNALIAKLEEAKISEEAYQEQIKNLTENFDIQKVKLEALAATFARVNFDDASPIYQEALEIYKEGKLKEAIAKLETVDLAKQTKDILGEIKRIAEVESKLEEDKRYVEEKKTQHISMLSTLANMYAMDFDPIRAEGIMDTLLLLDDNDLTILQKSADFFRDQHRYAKAKRLYDKIIVLENASELQKVDALFSLGIIATNTEDLNEVQSILLRTIDKCQELYRLDNNSHHKHLLAICYSALGRSQTKPSVAVVYFQNYNNLSRELSEEFPENFSFTNSLFNSYFALGMTHMGLGNLEKGEELLSDCISIYFAMFEEFPFKTVLESQFATFFFEIGNIFFEQGDFEEALEILQDELYISKTMYEIFPGTSSYKLSLAKSFSNLGDKYQELGNWIEAEEHFHEGNKLVRELYEEFPENVKFKSDLAQSYYRLALLYEKNDLAKVIDYLKLSLQHYTELAENVPQNVEYKIELELISKYLQIFLDRKFLQN